MKAADIPENLQSGRRLRRSEQDFADFFENAALGLHWVGPDGIILRANRAELELLGYSADEYVGRHIAEFHADQDVISDILRRLGGGEEIRDYPARLRCKDGSIRHVVINSNVLWEDGRFIHTRCFTLDITGQKRAEAARETLHQQLATELADTQRLQEISAQLIREGDANALYQRLLDAAMSIMRSDMASMQVVDEREDALRMLAWRGFGPEFPRIFALNRPDTRTSCSVARRVGERVIVPDVQTCDFIVGTPALEDHLRTGIRAVQSTPLISREGHVLGMISTHWRSPHQPAERDVRMLDVLARQAADLIESRQAEEALRKQSERLRLLSEAASELLRADDPDVMLRGVLVKIGPHLGVDTYFNYMVDDTGESLCLASCVGVPAQTARAIHQLEFGQAICGTVALQRQAIVATHIQDSDEPTAQLIKSLGLRAYACNPLISNNELLGTLSFASRSRDEFDPEELTFLETISQYVTVAYERLRLLDQLRAADRRKDEFLATLAHELRNPLGPVRNAVQVLCLKGPDEPELRWSREVIIRQVEHLTRLIDDLLDLSRITRSKLELRRQPVELAEVVGGAVESVRPILEERGHDLAVTLPTSPVYLNGDPVRLAQVFVNLLTNAAKYTDSGGRISLTAEQQGGEVVVRVIDTGVGIPGDKLRRVFEMFFQVDRSLERAQGGLGIGLALVRQLVELHGGRVEARSEGAGKGSEFIVRLPILAEIPKVVPPQRAAEAAAKATAARRILVVDDNRDAADSLGLLLQTTGNEIHTAYDGLQAVEAAQRFRPDVALLDIGMPGLNGHAACRRIREESWGKDMVLIALTGWGQEEDRRLTLQAGFDAHIVKPVDPAALMTLLDSLAGDKSSLGKR